jgi:heptosyltransferase-2
MKVLVISFAGIGDSVLATPLFRALSEQLPAAKIDVFVRWPGSRDLLQGSPYLNTIFYEQSTLAKPRLLWRLRRTHYDISINAYPQSKIEYRIIAWFINAHKRLSHRYDNYSRLDNRLITLSLEQDYGVHCVQNSLNLLKLLNLQLPNKPIEPEVFLSAHDEQWAEDFLPQNQLVEKPLLGVHVGSGTTKNLVLKRWPVSHYIQLIQKVLAAEPEIPVLLFGGPEEKEANAEILKAVESKRVQMVPSRTIKQATAVLKKCDLFLSVDNLFMHLAAIVKVPQQIVIESPTFNKTVEPYRRPYRLVRNPMVAGRNLEYYRFDGRDVQGSTAHLLACMKSISPEAVFDELQHAFAERRAGVNSRVN